MADTGLTVWAAGFWPDDFWAAGFWASGDAPDPTPTPESNAGGWSMYFAYERAREQRARRRRELQEEEEQQKLIEDKQSREIAELLRIQEEKDAERADLERIQALADNYVKAPKPEPVPASVRAALYNAYEQRTKNALEQMRREIERLYEEEELAIIAALLMDD